MYFRVHKSSFTHYLRIVFTTSFGPGGFRTTRVHLGGRRAQPNPAAAAQGGPSAWSMLIQLTPIIIMFLFTLLSAMPSFFGSSGTPDPRYSFTPSVRFNVERETADLKVHYFVNQGEFSTHPISQEVTQQATGQKSLLKKFERSVENNYKDQLYMLCQRDQERQQRRKEQKMVCFLIVSS